MGRWGGGIEGERVGKELEVRRGKREGKKIRKTRLKKTHFQSTTVCIVPNVTHTHEC